MLDKFLCGNPTFRLSCVRQCLLILVVVLLLMIVALLTFTKILDVANQQDQSNDEIDDQSSSLYLPTDTDHLPSQCLDIHQRFHRCQYSDQPPVVLACHRLWCHSFYGHCEACSGIGDRSIRMLGIVRQVLEQCLPVQLDYPMPHIVSLVQDAMYRDPLDGTIWESLLHQRSYKTPLNRYINFSLWGQETSVIPFSSKNSNPLHRFSESDLACLFHILFRPVPSLQALLDQHLQRLMEGGGDNKNNNGMSFSQRQTQAIGIHLRTGDSASFGIVHTRDNRIGDFRLSSSVSSSSLTRVLGKMISCARELGDQLFPPTKKHQSRYTIFLSTDNIQVKQLAATQWNTTHERFSLYFTKIQPRSFLRQDGERDAWLELYLLSRMQGLVVNVSHKSYNGTAGRTSRFSKLASQIGFIQHVKECLVDESG